MSTHIPFFESFAVMHCHMKDLSSSAASEPCGFVLRFAASDGDRHTE